eukprot:GHVS01107160.1.p1 GENE.GHVS01107160.1~~GHVS01107160.1.p1  ORF type:complete len:155 (+),score=9.66 GHVS01107160.1:534-998(+)
MLLFILVSLGHRQIHQDILMTGGILDHLFRFLTKMNNNISSKAPADTHRVKAPHIGSMYIATSLSAPWPPTVQHKPGGKTKPSGDRPKIVDQLCEQAAVPAHLAEVARDTELAVIAVMAVGGGHGPPTGASSALIAVPAILAVGAESLSRFLRS